MGFQQTFKNVIEVVFKAGKFNQQMQESNRSVMQYQRNMQAWSKNMKRVLQERGLDNLVKKNDSLAGSLRMGKEEFGEMTKSGRKFSSAGGRFGSKVRMMTAGLKGFRMEMLGVMFFGMAMQKFFVGLLQPALEAAGVFDLIRIVLQVLFLPIIILLLPYLIKLAEWFINLPEPIKKVIGAFVILGAIVGTVLFLFGMMSLGIGAMIEAFGGMGAFFSKAATVIVGVIFIVWGAFRILKGYLESDWWTGVSGVLLVFAGLIILVFGGWIPLAIGAAIAALVLLGDKFPSVAGAIMTAMAPPILLLLGLADIIRVIIKLITGDFSGAWDVITGKTSWAASFMSATWAKVTGKIADDTEEATVETVSMWDSMFNKLNEKTTEGMSTNTATFEQGLGSMSTAVEDKFLPSTEVMKESFAGLTEESTKFSEELTENNKEFLDYDKNLLKAAETSTAFADMITSVEIPALQAQALELSNVNGGLEKMMNLQKKLRGGRSDSDFVNMGKAMQNGFAFEKMGAGLSKITDKATGDPQSFQGGRRVDDFIYRPGQAPISVNPNDTLVGFKGSNGAAGAAGGMTINQTNNISVGDRAEFERIINDNNTNLIDELRRNI